MARDLDGAAVVVAGPEDLGRMGWVVSLHLSTGPLDSVTWPDVLDAPAVLVAVEGPGEAMALSEAWAQAWALSAGDPAADDPGPAVGASLGVEA